jgi:hypothetical protein
MKFPKIDLCCGTDELRPALNYVCVTKDYTFASDAHVLVRHKTNEIFKDDFCEVIPESGIMIHRNAFAIMRRKSTNRITLSEDKKTINLHQVDGSIIAYNCQPDYKSPAPGYSLPSIKECKPLDSIAVNANLLVRLAEGMGAPRGVLRMYFYEITKNILCDDNKEGNYFSAIGVIMPIMIH